MTLPISLMPGAKMATSLKARSLAQPVVVVERLEDLLVAVLAAERLDGTDAAERLDEVHDHQSDGLARAAVGDRRVPAEPAGQPEQEGEAQQRDQTHRQVEDEQDGADGDHRESREHEVVDTAVEQLAQRVDVAREPRDDASGRVRSWKAGESRWKWS